MYHIIINYYSIKSSFCRSNYTFIALTEQMNSSSIMYESQLCNVQFPTHFRYKKSEFCSSDTTDRYMAVHKNLVALWTCILTLTVVFFLYLVLNFAVVFVFIEKCSVWSHDALRLVDIQVRSAPYLA